MGEFWWGFLCGAFVLALLIGALGQAFRMGQQQQRDDSAGRRQTKG